MRENISIKQWQSEFANGNYNENDFHTQVKAGWYDWFCKTSSLRNKTYKMGKIIMQVKEGGKIDLNTHYVWFKNNCPMSGPLYDDFRFAALNDGEVQMTIQIDCCWNKHKYGVYGRLYQGGKFLEEPLFECDNSKDLVKWLNTPWGE